MLVESVSSSSVSIKTVMLNVFLNVDIKFSVIYFIIQT